MIAACAAAFVFGLWYPFPYRDLAGGRSLFLLVVSVDVVCGPLLTAVLFNPAKPRNELWRDLGLVVLIQVGALAYGLHSVWLARPLYLVLEVDRFKVIAAPDLVAESAVTELAKLPPPLKPSWASGPITVATRAPRDAQERDAVMFEAAAGGRDYAERPEFYIPYEGPAALKSLQRAKPVEAFLDKNASQRQAAEALAIEKKADLTKWQYLPVVGRQEWIAILNQQGVIEGFLHGNGF